MRERLIKLIQEAVGGCATHWAGLIADHLIENGLIAPQWISVKDRLPGEGEDVIACGKTWMRDECVREVSYMTIGGMPSFSYDSMDGGEDLEDVTHWMPLPEPPKEEAATDIPKELNPSQ